MNRERPLAGLRIGYTDRQSKTAQLGNASGEALDGDMREHLLGLGAEPVLFDENEAAGKRGVSGRDISKRDEFQRLLDGVKRKPSDPERLDGIGGWDIKRVTRDESGRDAGIIYRALVKHRALLVTIERIYRLWLESDHMAYQFECLKAGWDIRSINGTFWRGIFQTAEGEPFFRGVPPVGYDTREELVPDPKVVGGSKVKRTPRKHPGEQALMTDLRALLEAAASQGEVAAGMWEKWGVVLDAHDRKRHATMRGGWHAGRVAAILANPLYWGEWTLGGQCDRLNPLWDIARRREKFEEEGKYRHVLDGHTACPCGRAHENIGVLAYWTREQARSWRARLCPEGPQRRHRLHQHPLLGVLACAACGAPMIGAGRHGYVCAGRNTRSCAAPQQLAEGAARRVLRGLLPEAVERGRAAIERAARLEQAARGRRTSALAKKRRELLAVQEAMRGMLALAGASAKTSPTAKAEYDEYVRREAALLEEVGRLERGERVATDALERMDELGGMLAWFEGLTGEEQGHLYRLLLADVRIAGEGRGAGRTYRVVGAPRHLLEEQAADTTIRVPSPRSISPYVPISRTLTDLAALLKRGAAA